MAQAQQITILDASTGRPIIGKLIKQYPLGLTIEDAREIRYYATMSRVLTQPTPQPPQPGNNGNLF